MATDGDKLVHLYYLGGLEGKSKIGRVTADGRALALPPAGKSIEVTKRVADQLMHKHLYLMPNGDYAGAFTLDRRVAQRVAEGMSIQDAHGLVSNLSSVKVDVLLDELKRRGIELPKEEPPTPKDDGNVDDDPVENTTDGKKAKSSKAAKKTEAVQNGSGLLGQIDLEDDKDDGEK